VADKEPRREMVKRSTRSQIHRAAPPNFQELGVTGLRQYGGFVVEEWLRQLSGPRAMWVYREMADNDATVGAFLFAIEMLARGVEWTVEEGGNPKDAEFIEECRTDMSSTWEDFLSEVLTMLVFGWELSEIVYKKREGPEADVASRYSDGKIGWRKLPIRAQETLWRWQFDETGGVQAMEQQPWDGQIRTIPMEKALLFRTKTTKGNPQGRSLLRNAFPAWYRKKNIEEIEAIGIERDLAGIPMLAPPDGIDLYAPQHKKLLEAAEELVSTVRRDEDEGIVLPQSGWEFELVTTGGSRQIDTNEVINRYKQDIATSVLADMLLIGQDKVGSYAMVDVKADIFGAAVDTWLDGIAAVMNRYAIPRLLKLNGMSLDDPPQLSHGTTRRVDLDAVAQMLERLASTGAVIFPDDDLLASLFKEAGLPAPAATQTEKAEKRAEPHADIPPLGRSYLDAARSHEHSLQRAMRASLNDFGEEAATAYERTVRKAVDVTPADREAAEQILREVGAAGFARSLTRKYLQHYQEVFDATVSAFKHELEDQGRVSEFGLTREARGDLLRDGGRRVGLLDIERQLKDSIFKALADAREAGEGWKEAAERIRRYVPSGKFVKAGSGYRSQLIARTETANAQRQISLAAYRAHPEVEAVELLDGLTANSDAECMARNGEVVSFQEAEALANEEHPAGTLTLLPAFSKEIER
jgi:hypothetical protein